MEAVSKLRKLSPKKLQPPPEVIQKMIDKNKCKLSTNKYIRFFQIFFGEGF